MTQHTPGPWTIYNLQDGTFQVSRVAKKVMDTDPRIVADQVVGEANARLIAAAPEMKKELRIYVVSCACGAEDDLTKGCYRCTIPRALLATVEG